MHQKAPPACITSRYSKREAGWKFNVQFKLATGAKKARQWARPRSPFLRKVISQFVLIVTATSVTELLEFPNSSIPKLIRECNQLFNVRSERLYHRDYRVCHRATPMFSREHERCRGKTWRQLPCRPLDLQPDGVELI